MVPNIGPELLHAGGAADDVIEGFLLPDSQAGNEGGKARMPLSPSFRAIRNVRGLR